MNFRGIFRLDNDKMYFKRENKLMIFKLMKTVKIPRSYVTLCHNNSFSAVHNATVSFFT